MNKVLVQRTHNVRLDRILPRLTTAFDTVVVAEHELCDAIRENRHKIAGFLLFHLTDLSTRAASLVVQERFNVPTTPIAHLGNAGEIEHLPYGARHFGSEEDDEAIAYLSCQRVVRVLVVEDDPGIRDVLVLSLSKHFEVDAAVDGAMALEHLDSEAKYDIIVLDVMLPRVSGEDVFAHARKVRGDTPILVITAYDTEERALRFAFGGADGYVAKPFSSNLHFRQKLLETLCAHHETCSENARPAIREATERALEAYRDRMSAYT